MICCAMFQTGKVLKANGTYDKINNIKAGDYVMNMYGKPVKVRKVVERKTSNRQTLLEIKHDNWYKPTCCLEFQNILAWDHINKTPFWVQADFLNNDDSTNLVIPADMQWTLRDSFDGKDCASLSPSYELGFIFGVYLRLGYLTNKCDVNFHCETCSKDIIKMIEVACDKLFKAKVMYGSTTFISDIKCNDEMLYDIFQEFSNGISKYLPEKYMCSDKEYLQGLNHGIVFSGVQGCPSLKSNPRVYEILYWTSLTLKKPINYGQLMRKFRGVELLTGKGRVYSIKRGFYNMYTLDVECDTGSFIVDNIVVRND